jgi:hypothetical protein
MRDHAKSAIAFMQAEYLYFLFIQLVNPLTSLSYCYLAWKLLWHGVTFTHWGEVRDGSTTQ